MKTIRWFKVSVILQVIFVISCIISVLSFKINLPNFMTIFTLLRSVLLFCWVLNPTGLLTLILGLVFYGSDKKNPENLRLIGKKWIWFILFFVIDLIIYFTSIISIVLITGGV